MGEPKEWGGRSVLLQAVSKEALIGDPKEWGDPGMIKETLTEGFLRRQ